MEYVAPRYALMAVPRPNSVFIWLNDRGPDAGSAIAYLALSILLFSSTIAAKARDTSFS
jgi:hypothetical protein